MSWRDQILLFVSSHLSNIGLQTRNWPLHLNRPHWPPGFCWSSLSWIFSTSLVPIPDRGIELEQSTLLPTNDITALNSQLICCPVINWKKYRWPRFCHTVIRKELRWSLFISMMQTLEWCKVQTMKSVVMIIVYCCVYTVHN